MRRTFAGLTITAFLVALSAPAFAATETVKGQVVDMGCYKADKSNTGVDHKMPKARHQGLRLHAPRSAGGLGAADKNAAVGRRTARRDGRRRGHRRRER